ncbi:MAG: B12-binding domain-containing radical SAM protein, partial [Planctomycetia bacterium]|nr:B12-binding domain-containing radical SAM protein [Planctomycetia bacterium]
RRPEYLQEAREALFRNLRRRHVKLKFHNIQRSVIEGTLARGDRRVAQAVYEAWRAGARFDAWDETLNMSAWTQGLRAAGVDPDFYAYRGRGEDEVFPWDRVDMGVSRQELLQQFHEAMQILEE